MGFFGVSISNPFKSPLSAITDIFALPVTAPLGVAKTELNLLSPITNGLEDAGAKTLGLGTASERRDARDAQSRADEQNARISAFNDALTDNSLDSISQRDIANLYASGANSATIAATLANARQGKGIYAVRKVNQAQQDYLHTNPGRQGLLTTGSGLLY